MKERLIGAAVLVVLAVVFVPWVLDGDGEHRAETVPSLELPVSDAPLPIQRQTLNLDDDAAPEPPAAVERGGSASGTAAADDGEAGNALAAADATGSAEHEEAGGERAAAAQSNAASAQRQAAAAAAPAEQPPEAPAAPQTALAKRTGEAARTSASGAWQVQLGSFSEEENARRLAQRVSTFGHRAAISNVRSNGRTLYRVRVGPHATREQASAAASSLSAHGFVAQVVSAD